MLLLLLSKLQFFIKGTAILAKKKRRC